MPTIELIFKDLQRLVGQTLPTNIEDLNEIFSFIKGEVEYFEDDKISFEIKDGNRIDLWSVEGIARALRGVLGIEEGLKDYRIEDASNFEVDVDPALDSLRPFIGCSIVKGVELDDDVIRGLIHLQDKLDQTQGRRRRRTSIGLYNYDLIEPPLNYKAVKPESEISFNPLEFTEAMTLPEILKSHPKGLEYGHIVNGYNLFPILMDSREKILSFIPIINSNDLGKITNDVENVMVEVTGTLHKSVLNTLMMVTLSLADRGGSIFSVKVNYPHREKKSEITPILSKSRMIIRDTSIKNLLGIELEIRDVIKLLEKARFDAFEKDKKQIEVTIPFYRTDIMHQVDVIEDIAIMYGFNKIGQRWPRHVTLGKISSKESFSDIIRELMIGLGFQEILNFSMSNLQNLFNKMKMEPESVIKIANPKTLRYTCIRNWLIPSLMECLSRNTHIEYPQKIFEVGECMVFDDNCETGVKESRKIACLITHSNANFSETKSILDALTRHIGIKYELKEIKHPSFIEGRIGKVIINKKEIGVIGEINPKVIEEWSLENPISGFELDLEKTLEMKT
jgi:phenylalanyl-tRNA synthetase beta chain